MKLISKYFTTWTWRKYWFLHLDIGNLKFGKSLYISSDYLKMVIISTHCTLIKKISETLRFGMIRFENKNFLFTIWCVSKRQWNQPFWHFGISLTKRMVSLPTWNESYWKWKLFVPKTDRSISKNAKLVAFSWTESLRIFLSVYHIFLWVSFTSHQKHWRESFLEVKA